jgi:hypothetical protein
MPPKSDQRGQNEAARRARAVQKRQKREERRRAKQHARTTAPETGRQPGLQLTPEDRGHVGIKRRATLGGAARRPVTVLGFHSPARAAGVKPPPAGPIDANASRRQSAPDEERRSDCRALEHE